ncbi:hypothetical protein EV356DRAFT_530136 [Viridothelium virens]|uniref:Uncharacterized protein n=1 Tax=Viridothelium virens TaxID=1048519 RepID=A0A6A6HH08_VIRVR|nr:hypothetical protein EV356DRAFT_530136 [Viridothelium virens]
MSEASLGRESQFIPGNPQQDAYDDDSSSSSNEGEDEDSDKDDTNEEAQEVETSVEEQLTKVLHEMKHSGKRFGEFDQEVKDRIAMKTRNENEPTTLHILAIAKKDELPDERFLKPLIKFLVRRPERLLAKKDDGQNYTPLHHAILKNKTKMVKWMCEADAEIDKILSMKSQKKKNCLHVAIEKRSKMVDYLIGLASPDTLSAKDFDDNTPLHLAVECQRCDEKQLELIEAIVEKCDDHMRDTGKDFNAASRSPYLHHLYTCEQGIDMEKAKMDVAIKKPREENKANNSTHPQTDGQKNKKQTLSMKQTLSARSELSGKGQQRLTAVSHPTNEPLPNSPTVEGVDENRTRCKAGVPAKDAEKEPKNGNQSPTLKKIRDFLKLHYLRTRDHDAALEILYGRYPNSGHSNKATFLDLSGYSTKDGASKAISILKFEDILQYVKIPRMRADENSLIRNASKSTGQMIQSNGNGRGDLVKVFESLKGVNTILKVTVDDLKPPAHSDEAIEDALRGKNVEIWDWKKIDLCPEVIYNAAPKATEIHLHWSGNNAVLRGWSEEDGLPKLTQLRKIELYVEQGLEQFRRVKTNVAEFKRRIGVQMKRESMSIQGGIEEAIKEGNKTSTQRKVKGTQQMMGRPRHVEINVHYPIMGQEANHVDRDTAVPR